MERFHPEEGPARPLGLNLLAGLYLFFFLVSASTFGNPFPFMGTVFDDGIARFLVFADSLTCLYLFLGILKRQLMTWYFLLGYNLLQVVNVIVNLRFIKPAELERIVGSPVQSEAMVVNNVAASLAILLLSQFIYRHRGYFSNRRKYLF